MSDIILVPSPPPAPATAWGTVVATAPLEVLLAGDSVSVPVPLRDASYVPAEGDRVWLQLVGTRWMVGGRLVGA